MLNNLPKLNLPFYIFKTKTVKQSTQIFDTIRKKFIELTPEEWVRQHFINYLITEKKYPASLFLIEKGIKVKTMNKRTDIIVYSANSASPHLLVECKAPTIKITQDAFMQAANYNLTQKVTFLIVTNGINHFCCKMNYTDNSFEFIEEIPEYSG